MLDESLLDHPIFSRDSTEEFPKESDKDFDDFYSNIEKHLNAVGIEFPSFVTYDVPKEKYVISYDEDRKLYYSGLYTNTVLADLYDFIEKDLKSDADFDESCKNSPQVVSTVIGVSVKSTRSGFSRLLIPPVDHRGLDVWSYYSFLQLAKEWIATPDDVVLAFAFIENHPAFWYRYDSNEPNQWLLDNGHHSLWVRPTLDEDGKLVVMMEHGSTVPPDYTHHYHDPRLDVWGTSFEDAYIQTAKKLHKYFYLDGEERPDIEYQKQGWELEIEKRLENIDKE